ncbi:MAG: hypothetical protein WDA72_01280 [Desulfomonilia bacterium]
MEASQPGGWTFEENENGEATRFIREVLAIYRQEKGLERIDYPKEEPWESESDEMKDEEDFDDAA